VLPAILSYQSGLPVVEAEDGAPLASSRIYVAPPGLHTRVADSHLEVVVGPRENGHRPSIDVLFRSAARSFGERVIGVVLSGALDCGAAGLVEIKERGGIAIVQDPKSALNPQMPASAMDVVRPDYVVAPEAMGPLLAKLVTQPVRRRRRRALEPREKLSAFVCPDCNGPIWESGDGVYRCRVGHRFSAEGFFDSKEQRVENALWEALNVMQERIDVCRRMAQRSRENGHLNIADKYDSRASETEENAALLRDLIYRSNGMSPFDQAGMNGTVAEKNGKKKKPKKPRRV
jgi:two-component system chemotaxis response regulator CheB